MFNLLGPLTERLILVHWKVMIAAIHHIIYKTVVWPNPKLGINFFYNLHINLWHGFDTCPVLSIGVPPEEGIDIGSLVNRIDPLRLRFHLVPALVHHEGFLGKREKQEKRESKRTRENKHKQKQKSCAKVKSRTSSRRLPDINPPWWSSRMISDCFFVGMIRCQTSPCRVTPFCC